MEAFHLEMLPQPDETTCGPTSLQAVYRYWGDELPLSQVIAECSALEEGGTLASLLGRHALDRGYSAVIYSFNVAVFDPTWFAPHGDAVVDLREKLTRQAEIKEDPKLRLACGAYVEFLKRGGVVRMEDLTRGLIRRHLGAGVPILTGLSSTFLYRAPREIGAKCVPDDVRGVPTGHFVVLCGYDRVEKRVQIADPYLPNPLVGDHYYSLPVDRVVCAILLGALTYDANLLLIQPLKGAGRKSA